MNYQPFLIAPFQTGLDTDAEPWMLPQDAFSDIVNGHIRDGVIEKRSGYLKTGDIVHQDQTNWKITAATQASPCVLTLTGTTGLTNGDTVEIRNVGGMTELNGHQYEISAVGAANITLTNVDSTNFTAYTGTGDVYLIDKNPVMGLERYISSANVKEVIAFDTERACKYNTSSRNFDPIDSADIMSGTATDYICACNWASTASSATSPLYRMYFTNGKALSGGLDGIRYYNGGTTTTSYAPSINGVNTLNGCKLIFAYHKRIVCLYTYEGATSHPQRARWCEINNPDGSDAWYDNRRGRGGFSNASTGDHIISAQLMRGTLIVFFTNSVWALTYTGDPNRPFRWQRINDFRACDGIKASEQFDQSVISVGIRGIVASDGTQTQRIDNKIFDFVSDDINHAYFSKVFVKRDFPSETVWMLYPKAEDTTASAALVFDQNSQSFSKYEIAMNVLGYGGPAIDFTWQDFGDKTFADFGNERWIDYYFDEGTEALIGGNTTGEVFLMEFGSFDNEELELFNVVNATTGTPCTVTIDGNLPVDDGDTVTVTSVGGLTGINDREWVVANKSGNSFELQGSTSSGAYTTGGYVGILDDFTPISFELTSAAWNPYIKEGRKCQMGYLDILFDADPEGRVEVEFYINSESDPYVVRQSTLLPNVREVGLISNITQANPGAISCHDHGLSTGDTVYIYGVDGMRRVNGQQFTVTVDNDYPDIFTIGVDTSSYNAYTGGGVVTQLQFYGDRVWKRFYAGGIGMQHTIVIRNVLDGPPLRMHAFMPWFRPVGARIQ